MNALAPISFASAYRQLKPAEKLYVDGYIAETERDAQRRNERISLALQRAIPAHVVEASRGMLERPLVRAAIAERINELAAAAELNPMRVIKEYMSIGFSSVGDYMTIGEDGQPYFDLTKCTPEQLAAIQSVEVEETGDGLSRASRRKFKFRLHNKLDALNALAKHMGLLEADNATWRAETARPVGDGVLPATVDAAGAADEYARLIGG